MQVIYLSDKEDKPKLITLDETKGNICELVDGYPTFATTGEHGDTSKLADYELWYGDEAGFREDSSPNLMLDDGICINGPCFITMSDDEGEMKSVDDNDYKDIKEEIEKRMLKNRWRK